MNALEKFRAHFAETKRIAEEELGVKSFGAMMHADQTKGELSPLLSAMPLGDEMKVDHHDCIAFQRVGEIAPHARVIVVVRKEPFPTAERPRIEAQDVQDAARDLGTY